MAATGLDLQSVIETVNRTQQCQRWAVSKCIAVCMWGVCGGWGGVWKEKKEKLVLDLQQDWLSKGYQLKSEGSCIAAALEDGLLKTMASLEDQIIRQRSLK